MKTEAMIAKNFLAKRKAEVEKPVKEAPEDERDAQLQPSELKVRQPGAKYSPRVRELYLSLGYLPDHKPETVYEWMAQKKVHYSRDEINQALQSANLGHLIKVAKKRQAGTWAYSPDGAVVAKKKIERLKNEIYSLVGDDILFDHLDAAIKRVEELQQSDEKAPIFPKKSEEA